MKEQNNEKRHIKNAKIKRKSIRLDKNACKNGLQYEKLLIEVTDGQKNRGFSKKYRIFNKLLKLLGAPILFALITFFEYILE